MKTMKYTPAACKERIGKDGAVIMPILEGTVELIPPTFDEKFEYMEQLGIQIDDKGEVNLGDMGGKLKIVRNFVKLSEKHYKEVSLKIISTGEELKSFSDMSQEDCCFDTLIEIATSLVNGFKLGNVQPPR